MTIEMLFQKNSETVHRFLSSGGAEEVRALFTPDARVEYESADRKPMTIPATQWLMDGTWVFDNTRIYTGDDPDTILAETDKIIQGDLCYLITEFLLKKGKIRRYREIPNPTVALHR